MLDRLVPGLVKNWHLVLFVVFQIVLLVVAWRKLSTEDNAWHTRTNAWASILTVFGIFGTFIGICLGLWRFEVTNIEGSIGPLLEGLKLAFLTSLVGILSSLILKSIALFQESKDQSSEEIEKFVTALTETLKTVETSGESNLASQLKALTTTVEREGQETRESLVGIKTDLTGIQTAFTEGQNATLTQLQSLTATFAESYAKLTELQSKEGNQTRQALKEMETTFAAGQSESLAQLQALTTTFAEKHELLVDEFRAFSQNLADSIAKLATEELIGALKTVIEDFNTKISEQFGDNFKQLNEAVGRTVEWQEQYRQQMSELISQMSELIGGLGDAADTFEQARSSLKDIAESSRLIAERSDSIVACAEKLKPILHTLNNQLDAFSELGKKAQEAFPLIEDRLTELTTGFSAAVTKAITDSHASMAEQRDALTAHSEQIQTTLGSATQELTELTNSFSELVQTTLDLARTSTDEQKEALQQLQNVINAALEKTNREFSEVTARFSKVVEDTVTQSQLSMRQQREELANLTRQLQENFRLLESTLEAELASCLKVLAGQLAGLSEKFVKDYTPLTEELHRIVSIARNVPPVDNRQH